MSEPINGLTPAATEKAPHVPDYLIWSVLAMLVCQPFGLAGVVYSVLASSKASSGDYTGALADAANAKKWAKIGAIVGGILYVTFFVIYGIFIALAVVGGVLGETSPPVNQ